MKVIIDQTGHKWMYDKKTGQYIMVSCACMTALRLQHNFSIQKPECPHPDSKPRGSVSGKKISATLDNYYYFEHREDFKTLTINEVT